LWGSRLLEVREARGALHSATQALRTNVAEDAVQRDVHSAASEFPDRIAETDLVGADDGLESGVANGIGRRR
jgi:hypothetical protein